VVQWVLVPSDLGETSRLFLLRTEEKVILELNISAKLHTLKLWSLGRGAFDLTLTRKCVCVCVCVCLLFIACYMFIICTSQCAWLYLCLSYFFIAMLRHHDQVNF